MLSGGVSIICHRTRQNFDLHGCDFLKDLMSQGKNFCPTAQWLCLIGTVFSNPLTNIIRKKTARRVKWVG
jgi:hypothetical protein